MTERPDDGVEPTIHRDPERILAEWFEEDAPRREPPVLLPAVLARTAMTRRRPAWRTDAWWSGLFGRRDRRFLTMTLSTGLTTSIVAMALAAALVLPGQDTYQVPDAAGGATHAVAADGSGDFPTISEAVAAAADGDTIMVKPGRYTEAVVIDKDITLAGDGPRDEIVVSAPAAGPDWVVDHGWLDDAPYAIVTDEADATLQGFTLRGENARLFFDGGSPLAVDLSFDEVGHAGTDGWLAAGALVINGDTDATVRGNTLRSGGGIDVFGQSDVIIDGNELIATTIAGDFGPSSLITGNLLSGEHLYGIGFLGDTSATISNNSIEDREVGIGYAFSFVSSSENTPTIEDNSIRRASQEAISLDGSGAAQVRGNVVEDSGMGVALFSSDANVVDNSITGEGMGIVIIRGGAPLISGNVIDVTGSGLIVGEGASPTVDGNSICSNGESIVVLDAAGDAELGANDTC